MPNSIFTLNSHPRRTRSTEARVRHASTILGHLAALLWLLPLTGCFLDTININPYVAAVPSISAQPVNQTVLQGQSASFTVVVVPNGPVTFQWYMNGTAIPQATSSTMVITATPYAYNGATIYVVVTNAGGSVTSSSAVLTVNPLSSSAPSLVCSNPAPAYDATIQLLPVFSSGNAVIGTAGNGSSDIATGVQSAAAYNVPPVTATTTYTMTVTGTGGSTATASCTAQPTPVTISPVMPANQTIAPGQLTFYATVSGGNTDNITWSATAGSFNGSTWTSPNVAGTYTITATSKDDPTLQASTTVTVSAPVILTQPTGGSFCPASNVTLAVDAQFASTYQWFDGANALPGATFASYALPSTAAADSGSYTCAVTNPAGTVVSAPATLAIGSSFTGQPASMKVGTPQTATFSVSVTGHGPFTYQWYSAPVNSTQFTPVAGATFSSYTTPATTTNDNGTQFYVAVTDSCGTTLNSSTALLTVDSSNVPPTITQQPVSQSVAAGAPVTFTVAATGTPKLTYQWYRVPAGSTMAGAIAISGANTASYTAPGGQTTVSNDQDGYFVIVSNNYGEQTSRLATLAVGAGIVITSQPGHGA